MLQAPIRPDDRERHQRREGQIHAALGRDFRDDRDDVRWGKYREHASGEKTGRVVPPQQHQGRAASAATATT